MGVDYARFAGVLGVVPASIYDAHPDPRQPRPVRTIGAAGTATGWPDPVQHC